MGQYETKRAEMALNLTSYLNSLSQGPNSKKQLQKGDRNMFRNLLLFLTTMMIAGPAWGQSIEEELMIETETAIADSEAAIQEAKEAEKVASEEKRRSAIEITRAKRELERAKREETKAKRDIARAERERSRAIEDTEKSKLEAEEGRQRLISIKDELEDLKVQQESSMREREQAEDEKKKVMAEVADIEKELKKMKQKATKLKKQELSAVRSLKRAELGLKDLQEKAKISYKSAEQDSTTFISALGNHRNTLRKISKKLDELEIEVEADKSFYDRQRRQSLTRNLGSTVAATNGKIAKVMTSGCNIRNFPSLSSKVVGTTNQGRKLKVRKYNTGWYTVIHDGQKAFMGAGCFQ